MVNDQRMISGCPIIPCYSYMNIKLLWSWNGSLKKRHFSNYVLKWISWLTNVYTQWNNCLNNCQDSKSSHWNVCLCTCDLAVLTHAQRLGYIACTVVDGKSSNHPLVTDINIYIIHNITDCTISTLHTNWRRSLSNLLDRLCVAMHYVSHV